MPELPEVEILRKGLESYIVGLTIADVVVREERIVSGEVDCLTGAKVIGIRRFGKMLCVDLGNDKSIAIHVKMTGRLIYRGRRQPENLEVEEDLENLPNKHTHVIFYFKNEDKLFYNDVRKFGWIKIVETDKIENLAFVKKLGPEPFKDLSWKKFSKIVGSYKRPIKTLLMDQGRVSGVGNIYANEALFCAKISPKRKSDKISKNKLKVLYDCVLKVLEEGMRHGGSSTDSFRDVLGEKGEYQEHYSVYDREGENCKGKGCSGKIKKIKLAGRGTYFCPKCQN